ncbi:VOC family protein [Streptomyces adelaidensis]|uniref:VOC family protein n=1 Tax=Streptomyces adelaidensis TaxID=2796465 RepID=UPI0019083858|nr:VOC family protein [Streptomyces adelaidensis]
MDARLDHVGVTVRDLPAQTSWYQAAFGLRTVFEFALEGPGLRGVVLEHPHQGWRVELLARPGSVPGPRAPDPLTASLTEGYGHFAVTTPALDPVHRALLAHGAGDVMAPGPSPEPGVRMAWVSDPEGNLIELIEKSVSRRAEQKSE